MALQKREHLLTVAQRMFCSRGFHAVSVDMILEEAEVARMTLYKNFESKEELILAALRREDKEFRQWLTSVVEARSTRPLDRVASLFDGLHDRFAAEGYYGCAFIRASIEFPDAAHPAHRLAKEHKEMIRSYLRGLVAEAGAQNAFETSEQLYLLFEGAISASQLHGGPWAAEFAKQAALRLIGAPSESKAQPPRALRG
jgi:AcrR family transcriptional regulator